MGSLPHSNCNAATVVQRIDLQNFQTATTKIARDINRRVVLNLIRKHQPISRAEIARRSRLQRSTVSAITEQLIADRWVTSGAFGDQPRGRKPTVLHFNGARAGIIGIDLRPIETKVVLADLGMRFVAQDVISMNPGTGHFISVLCDCVSDIISSNPQIRCEGIGVAVPGRIDPCSNRLVFAPNLGWPVVDLKRPLSDATGLLVELENAANACALSEIWSETYPESVRNLVAITVSEGVGIGMILNGQLVRGASGLAGEYGHITIQENGALCNCGQRGCLDACGSNTAAIRYYNEIVGAGNGKMAQPSFDSIVRMAERNDRNAINSLNRMAHYLGIGIAMIAASLSPEVIVVAGEVTRAWKQIEHTITNVVKHRSVTGAKPKIIPTGPEARLRGAVALIMHKHFGEIRSI